MIFKQNIAPFLLIITFFGLVSCANNEVDKTQVYPPEGFVRLQKEIPNLLIDARYFGKNNFIGNPIKGYYSDSLILSKDAAKALLIIQKILKPQGYELKIFDAYRPQKAVNHFVEWAKDLNDTLMKAEFYPNTKKSNLFREGYIAEKSSHSRGSTVDLTLVFSQSLKELDMGSPYDFFGKISWPTDSTVSPLQYNNRRFLQTIMEENGFVQLPQEWWHFTLKNEAFPNQYFDFDLK